MFVKGQGFSLGYTQGVHAQDRVSVWACMHRTGLSLGLFERACHRSAWLIAPLGLPLTLVSADFAHRVYGTAVAGYTGIWADPEGR